MQIRFPGTAIEIGPRIPLNGLILQTLEDDRTLIASRNLLGIQPTRIQTVAIPFRNSTDHNNRERGTFSPAANLAGPTGENQNENRNSLIETGYLTVPQRLQLGEAFPGLETVLAGLSSASSRSPDNVSIYRVHVHLIW